MALLAEADRWYRASGGGDGALLARCLLASMSSESSTDERGAVATMEGVLAEANRIHDGEVLLLASDSLARLAAERGDATAARELLASADALATGMLHVVYDIDRVDAHGARALIGADSAAMPASPGP